MIPAAVLRDVFYNPKLPNYFNYATVGKALAQAIFEHVFDLNNESATDEDNDNYNSFRTLDIFESAVKCLTKESSSYMHNAEVAIINEHFKKSFLCFTAKKTEENAPTLSSIRGSRSSL